MNFLFAILFGLATFSNATVALAKISISPYYSISGTKSIKPDKANDKREQVTNKQRQTYGITAGVSFWRIFGLHLSVGQSKMTVTEKTQDAVDDFDEIDYEKDLSMDTSQPDNDVKTTETTNKARVGVVLDPGFWIFILRAKAGVQAQQRSMDMEQTGMEKQSYTEPITYKPYAGAGAGVRLSARSFFLAEYTFLFYKFPETEPFMREVSVSFGLSI